MAQRAPSRGRSIARLLAGSWRVSPPQDTEAQALETLCPTLLRFGSAGLVWWKIRNSALKSRAAAQEFQEAFRFYALRAAIHERNLVRLASHLHHNNIDFVLAKGWGLAHLYPHAGMRPYGDIDICVRPEQFEAAAAALASRDTESISIDLHRQFRELANPFDELFARSQTLTVAGTKVQVLSPEDHLRLVCIHMLYHGAWKHLWLCDVAMLLEKVGSALDWSVCLAGDSRRTEWVLAAIGLARQILGAKIPTALDFVSDHPLPRWVSEGVYSQWGQSKHYMQGDSAANLLREQGWIRTLRGRWPNALQATVRTGAPVNDWPRLPFQLADVVKRAAGLAKPSTGRSSH